jgi:hypothetical protein
MFPFDWVLRAVTFQLPLNFHLRFSYSKPHGLKCDKGGSFHYCLKNLCSIFHLNPMRQSKVISLPMRVPNMGTNGSGGTLYYVETSNILIDIWVYFGLPCALFMYINPIFRPLETHLHHFHLESETGA